jgi:hypothetical protein
VPKVAGVTVTNPGVVAFPTTTVIQLVGSLAGTVVLSIDAVNVMGVAASAEPVTCTFSPPVLMIV